MNTIPNSPIKREYMRPSLVIRLKDDLPFAPENKQVVYIESEYNKPLNDYISKEYAKILEAFRYDGYTFIYIPMSIKKQKELGYENIKYLYPALNDCDIRSSEGVDARSITKNILSFSVEPISLTGGLMRYVETIDKEHHFRYFQFTNFEEGEIWEQFRAYISVVARLHPLYSLAKPDTPEDIADDSFPYAAEILIEEIKQRVALLRQTGINEMVIKSLFRFDDAQKLSRLTITKDYRIFLPDYNNLEITMTPLPKAVYFLFLKYPEGILFKHLPDHREELLNIYKQLSIREKLPDMEKSIADVTDPTKNAINEKCSRIREAFVRHFDETIAKNYFITGFRAEPKTITLDRELVSWEAG